MWWFLLLADTDTSEGGSHSRGGSLINLCLELGWASLPYLSKAMSPFSACLGGSLVKNPPANAGDVGYTGLIPGSGRSLGIENGNPLQYSCLENSIDRGAWWAAVHRVTKT